MKLLQQAPQQQGPGAGGSGWSGAPSSGLAKAGKPPALALLEMQQEAERLLKQQQQQRAQQQRDRVSFSNLNYMAARFTGENADRKLHVISQSVSSTPACQWAARPLEDSGWMVLACGPALEVWMVRVAAEALQAAWACGTRLWRTRLACVATATTTWAWRTAAAVLHWGTWD